MKAILINSTEKTVTEIELDSPDTSLELQDLLGPIMCGWTWYNASGFPRNILYVNEEHVMTGYNDYFQIKNASDVGFCTPCGPTFLDGNGIILGVTEVGESMDTSIDAADLVVEFNGYLGDENIEI